MDVSTEAIRFYHAHVYFDAGTIERAKALCTAARDRFDLEMGRVHEKLVGPHPRWSCQLKFQPDQFAEVIPWLALNRDGLTVFVHPDTGQPVPDHRDHAIWLGDYLPLNLKALE